MVAYTASVLSRTGAEEAWKVQEEALELHRNDPLEQAILRLERAGYQLQAGSVDASASTATQALRDVAGEERTPLLMEQASSYATRLKEISPQAAADYRTHLTLPA